VSGKGGVTRGVADFWKFAGCTAAAFGAFGDTDCCADPEGALFWSFDGFAPASNVIF
jgi:hypothetical protein